MCAHFPPKENSQEKHDKTCYFVPQTRCKSQNRLERQQKQERGYHRLSSTDVIVLAVILFQLAAALMTKDVIKPLPLMFCFQTNAFFFF